MTNKKRIEMQCTGFMGLPVSPFWIIDQEWVLVSMVLG